MSDGSKQTWDNLIVGFAIGFLGTLGLAMSGTTPINLLNFQNAAGVGIATALAAFKDPNKSYLFKVGTKVDG